MPDYRLFIVAPNGRILTKEFTSAERREAACLALKFFDKLPLELWEGDEWIGTFKPGNPGCWPIFKRPARRRR